MSGYFKAWAQGLAMLVLRYANSKFEIIAQCPSPVQSTI